jgi:hypothetical protein
VSEPLAIAGLALPGGGRLGICRLPGAQGRLAADLRAIAEWRPTLVVSLTERAEMDACAALAEQLRPAGIGWRHFPVRDYGVPEGTGRGAWPQLAVELHAVLDRGEGVLLHCRGGRGRSGMAALRLLVERGEKPEEALARLREVRPGAVETEAQRAWATCC